MSNINNVDYSNWSNSKAYEIASRVDRNGVNGLQYTELIDFAREAKNSRMDKTEIYELLGISVNQTRSAKASVSRPKSSEFQKGIDYYNSQKPNSSVRTNITSQTYNKYLLDRLHEMEKGIDQAFIDCSAYQDINITPRWYYRFYPYMHDRLINFDIDEVRTRTSNDMASLQELKDNVQRVFEEANGETTHTPPQKTKYDIETMAIKHLGMSYADFAKQYKNEIDFCKTVTPASLGNMNQTQAFVYSKLKAYATEMINITINEAHTVRWDTGERQVEETNKATSTDDMFTIYGFEESGITDEGLNSFESGILYQAFEDAVVAEYGNYLKSGIDTPKTDNKKSGTWKEWINGKLRIHTPNGDYNEAGIKQR